MAGSAVDGVQGSISIDKLIADINAGFASSDTASVLEVLGMIARSRGMSQLAREMGVSRESLYPALRGQANPNFTTMLKARRCRGFRTRLAIKAAPRHGRSEMKDAADAARYRRFRR